MEENTNKEELKRNYGEVGKNILDIINKYKETEHKIDKKADKNKDEEN